jgi:hypothetical protein
MPRNNGQHRISRTTKIASAGIGLALAIGALVVVTTAGSPGSANADAANPAFFVDITKVKANVKQAKAQEDASTGTFTVDCGTNENGHFNPDNFIAQPGIKNGAQHLHDYVGNLDSNADSNNKSLLAAGTTCKNGDQSAYFWPVIRIDREDNAAGKNNNQNKQNAQKNQQQQNKKNQQQDANADNADAQDANGAQQDKNKKQNQDAQNADQADKPKNLRQRQNDNQQGGAQGGQNDKQDQNKQQGKQDQQNKKNQDQNADNQDQAAKDKAAADKAAADKAAAEELGGAEGANQEVGINDGEIQRAQSAEITFRGSPTGDVVAMPKFLKILYGDAKQSTNGPKNARDSWTCAGFEDKVLINKYPVCPNGGAVKRIHDFPSCWDGKNIDSTNHRDHIVFPDANGNCKNGFKAVPQLRITLTYNIPQDVQEKGQYKVDSFEQEQHNPASDHDDFANVMSSNLMNRVVDCINSGKTCKE